LQAEQQGAGTLRFDAIGGESVHNLEEGDLHIQDGIERWEVESADFGAAAETGALLRTVLIALVEVAEFLAAKGGRTAGDAICLEIVAGGVGHECLRKMG